MNATSDISSQRLHIPSEHSCELMENLTFATDAGIGARARIGLAVLSSDYTIEHEFRQVLQQLPGVATYVARIQNDMEITPDSLAAMGPRITDTVDRLLAPGHLQVVAYCCTSATVVLGEDAVINNVLAARPDVACTTPVTAAFAALRKLGAQRIAVLTPYRRDINKLLIDYFVKHGFDVPVFGSFNEQSDPVVAAIDAASIRDALTRMTARHQVDAAFVSCTSVRALEDITALEAKLKIPVTSSNQALAWHCLRLAGVRDTLPEFGQLFSHQLD